MSQRTAGTQEWGSLLDAVLASGKSATSIRRWAAAGFIRTVSLPRLGSLYRLEDVRRLAQQARGAGRGGSKPVEPEAADEGEAGLGNDE